MNTEQDTIEATIAPTAKRRGRQVAILAATAALAEAFQSVLTNQMKGATFTHIKKLSDRPDGAILASLGLPSFVPGNSGVQIISFGGKFQDNPTDESKKAQWEVLRGKDSSSEQIIAELGAPQTYTVLPGKVVTEAKLAIAEAKVDIAEAETPEEQLAAYKAAYTLLLALLD